MQYLMLYVLSLQSFCCQETHYCRMYGVMFYTNCTLLFVLLSCLFLLLFHFRVILFVSFLSPEFSSFSYHSRLHRSTSFSPIRPRLFYSKYSIHPQWGLLYFHFPETAVLSTVCQSSEYSIVTHTYFCLTNCIKVCVSGNWQTDWMWHILFHEDYKFSCSEVNNLSQKEPLLIPILSQKYPPSK
jgi:hypothetical protein